MGFDVSYHPITEQEIQKWYFDCLKDISDGNTHSIRTLLVQHRMDEHSMKKYLNTLKVGANSSPGEIFDKTHGFYIAVIQGFFRTYFYTRDLAFSFLLEDNPEFGLYTKPWQEILPMKVENPVQNKILDNYSSGVFIPPDQVDRLLRDYKNRNVVKKGLENYYSDDRIKVFLKTLVFCSKHRLGLLEATEVVEPNPLDLNKSKCFSNIFNCDKDGAFLHEEIHEENSNEKTEKKGFWSKLFKK